MNEQKILNYAVFKSNEELVEWQKANPMIVVCNVAPLVLGMTGGSTGSNSEQNIDFRSGVGAFVLYYIKEGV